MQRSIGDRVVDQTGKEVVISAEIPSIHVMTRELRYHPDDRESHDEFYYPLLDNLHQSKEKKNLVPDPGDPDTGRINISFL